jgi:hypothetical protein
MTMPVTDARPEDREQARDEAVAASLYRMNGHDRYGRDLGDWDDPTSRIGRNEAEREHWRNQAQVLADLGNQPPTDYAAPEVDEDIVYLWCGKCLRETAHHSGSTRFDPFCSRCGES